MNKSAFAFLILTLPIFSFGQTFREAVIKTPTGAYLVFTNDEVSFTIHLDSVEIEPYEEESNMYLAVDKKFALQLFTIPYHNPDSLDMSNDKYQKEFLANYMKYESQYFRNELKLSMPNFKTKWGLINLKRFLHWEFDTPEFMTIQTQIHFTTICFGNFLNINVPVPTDSNYDEAFEFIQYVASRLEQHDYPIDLEKFAREVNGLE